jgi:hypothetical protein
MSSQAFHRRPTQVALLALAIQLVASLAAGCKAKPKAPPGVLGLLPREAAFVAQAQVTRLRQTRLFQKALAAHPLAGTPADPAAAAAAGGDVDSVKAYETFRTETGFDLTRDLDSLTLAMPEDVERSRTFVVVGRGRFDEPRLVAYMTRRAEARGGKLIVENHHGVTLRGTPNEPGARLAFLDNSTVLFGSADWVKRGIDLSRGDLSSGAPLQKNDTLMRLIGRTRTERGLWAVAVIPEKLRDRLPLPGKKINLQNGSASLDLGSGLQLSLIAETASAAEASSVVEAGNGALALVRTFGPVAMGGYGPYIEAVKLTARDRAAELSLDLNQIQLDELIDRLERFLGGLKSSTAGSSKQ